MNFSAPLDLVRCPACTGMLSHREEVLACALCDARFPLCEGIPVLSQDSGYHFMRPTPEMLARAFTRMDSKGFDAGMDGLFREAGPEEAKVFRTYMLEETRAAWRTLLPSLSRRTVLDFGSGWGNLSVGMARSAGRVVGLDLSLQRVRFAARRAAHERLANVSFIAGGDGQRLPFADGTFDIAVLNGVLEWLPTSATWEGDPRSVQVRFLRELARITKPDGMVCIAIENRFGIKYWLGSRDEHTRIRFITLLPRWMADSVSLRQRGRPFREYTHSLWEYHRIAAEGGFAHSTAWIPHPDYREYDTLAPARSPQALAHATRARRRIVRWTGCLVSRIPELANAYIVIAAKQPQEPAEMCWRKRAAVGGRYIVQPDQAIRVLGTGSIVVFAREANSDDSVVVKMPLTPEALASCRKTVATISEFLADSGTPAWFRTLLPRPLPNHTDGNDEIFIQQRLPGVTGMELAGLHRNHTPYTGRAIALLERWHAETAIPATITPELLASTIAPLTARGLRLLALLDPVRAGKIEQTLNTALIGRKLPLVQFHGDFWLKNLIFDETAGEITGVIDWDRAMLRGMALFDLFHLLHLSQRLRRNPGFHATIHKMAARLESAPIANYRATLGLGIEDSRTLLALYSLFRLPDEVISATDADAAFVENLLAASKP